MPDASLNKPSPFKIAMVLFGKSNRSDKAPTATASVGPKLAPRAKLAAKGILA